MLGTYIFLGLGNFFDVQLSSRSFHSPKNTHKFQKIQQLSPDSYPRPLLVAFPNGNAATQLHTIANPQASAVSGTTMGDTIRTVYLYAVCWWLAETQRPSSNLKNLTPFEHRMSPHPMLGGKPPPTATTTNHKLPWRVYKHLLTYYYCKYVRFICLFYNIRTFYLLIQTTWVI